MFTGLIQQIGKLAGKEKKGGALRLIINTRPWNPPLAEGESIAVNGVCLTAAEITDHGFACDVLTETVRCSNLGAKQTGAALNLERATRAGEPLGGHLITGHVEGLGILTRRVATGRDWTFEFSCDKALLGQMVAKGSIACDGVSLTISILSGASFSVNIIPLTWANTNLQHLRERDAVNLETDLIGKYVFRWLAQNQRSSPFAKAMGDREIRGQKSDEKPATSITEDILRKTGFME